MIKCVVTIRLTCEQHDDDVQILRALEDGDRVEDALKSAGFLFTDIDLEPCDGKKVFEKEYK